MGDPIKREGSALVAAMPYGAVTLFVHLKSGPACVVSPKDAPPYFLFTDGTTKPLEPERDP